MLPCYRVCVKHLNRCKTSTQLIWSFKAGGHGSTHQSVANEATDVWRGYAVLSTARSCEPFYFTGHGTRLSRELRSWILFARLPQSGIYWFRDLRLCRSLIFIYSPHQCVGFLFFALHPPRPRPRPPALPPLITSHPSQHNSSHHLSQPPRHTALITAPLLTPHSSPLGRGWLLCGRRSTQSCCAHGRRWAAAGCRVAGAVHRAVWRLRARLPLGCGWLLCGRCSTQSRLAELLHALWSLLGRGWLLCGRCSNAVHRASWRSCCHFVTHHLWHHLAHTTLLHTIFDTPAFTHNFVIHTPSFTHTTLSHTIFDAPSFRHNFVAHHLSPDHLCHTPSFTTPSFAHSALSHTHTPSFLHLLCVFCLPGPRYNTSCPLFDVGLSGPFIHYTCPGSYSNLGPIWPRFWSWPCLLEFHPINCIQLRGDLPGINYLLWLHVYGIQLPTDHSNDPVLFYCVCVFTCCPSLLGKNYPKLIVHQIGDYKYWS